jgi:hypothetical protein
MGTAAIALSTYVASTSEPVGIGAATGSFLGEDPACAYRPWRADE